MSDRLATKEKAKYYGVYRDYGFSYRKKAHGLDLFKNHRGIFPVVFNTVVDLGCGQGRLFAYLNELGKDCWAVDIASNCLEDAALPWKDKLIVQSLWDMDFSAESKWAKDHYETWPGKFRLGICTDVMEHIPEARVGNVLKNIALYCDAVIFKIANFPARSLGVDLHPTMKDLRWWIERLKEVAPARKVEFIPIMSDREEYHLRWTT